MNEFVDMHVHSKFSIDGMSTMEDYCLIAGKTGTRVICFTEHVDFNSAEKNLSIVKDAGKDYAEYWFIPPGRRLVLGL